MASFTSYVGGTFSAEKATFLRPHFLSLFLFRYQPKSLAELTFDQNATRRHSGMENNGRKTLNKFQMPNLINIFMFSKNLYGGLVP